MCSIIQEQEVKSTLKRNTFTLVFNRIRTNAILA